MFDKKFLAFIEIWRQCFGIERSILEQKCVNADDEPLPWYTYPAIEYLSQFDYHTKKIFEYGCGNSSLFWALRAQKVVSVEDKPEWYEKWCSALTAPNLQIQLHQAENYEQAIAREKECFDVIVIDGIRRAQCAEAALPALQDGGIIILDDSDRVNTSKDYQAAIGLLKSFGLLQIDFYGFCPLNIYPKCTSIFFSRNFNFPLRQKVQPANGIGNLWSLSRKTRKEIYRLNME